METETPDFKERARKLLFDSTLKQAPIVFGLYAKAFGLDVDLDATVGKIVEIVRTSNTTEIAYTMVCHYLDGLEAESAR